MIKKLFKHPSVVPIFYAIIIVIVAIIIQLLIGKKLNLFPAGALPDYLGVTIAINLGLTFEYVRKAMYIPLRTKIRSMRAAAIAQLEDRGEEHPRLDKDLDSIEKSNDDQCRDYSRLIQFISSVWAGLGIIALICEDWVKNWGLPHVIFLWPLIYFLICLKRHRNSILHQMESCLEPVHAIETAESMLKKAHEAISGIK